MSSALMADPALGGALAVHLAGQDMRRVARLGMTPRQQQLNRYYAFYRALQYEARNIAWDGTLHVSGVERDSISSGNSIPPGFYDAGQTTPVRFRRPTAPYQIGKVIVNRFTSLLFSQKRHPQLRVDGDSLTEDYVQALAESARLWPSMIRARGIGGSMGTCVMGYKFVDSRPIVEVFDPRWVEPTFKTRGELKLKRVEIRYQYPVPGRDPATGAPVDIPCWYRRVIDEKYDVLWFPIEVGEGEEPNWQDMRLIESYVEHNQGWCPVVWSQNLPVEGDIDGDPDCHGTFEMIEAMDALISQADRGLINNCDPTLLLQSDQPLPEIRKGSDNAIKLTAAGKASYLELTGSGPKAARELAEEYRNKILEVAQCVLENPQQSGGQRTATEVDRDYSAMIAKADVLREQYGEQMVKPLLEMMLRTVRQTTKPVIDAVTGITRGVIALPDRVEKKGDTVTRIPRQLGPDDNTQLNLQWPGYFEPPVADANMATQAASLAQQSGLIDRETAGKYIAPFFNVEDVPAVLARARKEKEQDLASGAAQFLEGMSGSAAPAPGGSGGEFGKGNDQVPPHMAGNAASPDADVDAFGADADTGAGIGDPTEVPLEPSDEAGLAPGAAAGVKGMAAKQTGELKLNASDLGAIVTVNEARASIGLGPYLDADGELDEDGDLTLVEFKARHSVVVAAAAQASDGTPPGAEGANTHVPTQRLRPGAVPKGPKGPPALRAKPEKDEEAEAKKPEKKKVLAPAFKGKNAEAEAEDVEEPEIDDEDAELGEDQGVSGKKPPFKK